MSDSPLYPYKLCLVQNEDDIHVFVFETLLFQLRFLYMNEKNSFQLNQTWPSLNEVNWNFNNSWCENARKCKFKKAGLGEKLLCVLSDTWNLRFYHFWGKQTEVLLCFFIRYLKSNSNMDRTWEMFLFY